ncbi:MAG: 2-dehydropantoate 2-reductase [Hyphomicrobiales bacterium]|nr:2-dehydropantoate 2-reductase [Hyphomicrobiales bacterium]
MHKRIAVLGAGAIGCSVGADMTRAGHDVRLIDQWPEHVEAMRNAELRVDMPEGHLGIKVSALHLCDVASLKKPFDIVFLTSKSRDSVWLAHLIRPHLAPNGVLVSLQNSLNDEWIAPIIGYQRDVASVVELAAQMLGPGHVKRRTGPTKAWFALGELHGRVTPRVQELAAILGVAGKTEVTSNLWGAKWAKLIVNTMSHAVAAILRGTDSDVAENPKLLELGTALGRECLDVGSALGYRVEPIFGLTAQDMMGAPDAMLQRILITLCTHIGKHTNSFLQDMAKDRPSEVLYMNGLVAAKGREAGVPTPLNDEITRIVEQIESGEMTFGPEHLPRLESLVSSKHATDYALQ